MASPYTIAQDFRTQVDDTDSEDYLWSDAEVIVYMNAAQRDFAKNTLCITDASTASVVDLTQTADDEFVTYDDVIIEFDEPYLYSSSRNRNIPLVDKADFLTRYRNTLHNSDYGNNAPVHAWQQETGSPRMIIQNWEAGKLRLYPIPTANDTLSAVVVRLPINDITDISVTTVETFEIPAMFHEDLLIYMQYRAYQKQDAETYDRQAANQYLAEWKADTLMEAKRMMKRTRNAKSNRMRYRAYG